MDLGLDSWLDEIKEKSAMSLDYLYCEEQDDRMGLERMLDSYISAGGLKRSKGLFFVGESGAISRAAYAAVRKFCERCDDTGKEYNVLFLSDEDFSVPNSEGVGKKQAIGERLNYLLDDKEIADKELCLVTELTHDNTHCEELCTQLGYFSRMYFLSEELPTLFQIVTSSSPIELPTILRSRLTLCRFALPDSQRRLEYLSSFSRDFTWNSVIGDSSYGISLDSIAQMTDGMSYDDLDDMVRRADMFISVHESFTAEQFYSVIEESIPPKKDSDIKRRIAIKLEKFLDEVPDKLGVPIIATGTAVQQTADSSADNPDEQDEEEHKTLEDEREIARHMTTKELAKAVLAPIDSDNALSDDELDMVINGHAEHERQEENGG